MFLQNKYTNYYYQIIERSKLRASTRVHAKKLLGYVERHHIIPKSLGGADDSKNLTYLTAKEHFTCHHLLTKMVEGKAKRSMWHALWNIVNQKRNYQERYKVTSRTYEQIRKANSEALSESNKGKTSNRKGKPCTWGDKISITLKGFKPTPERNAKVSKALTGKKRPPRSNKWNENLKNSIIASRITCEQCGKNITKAAHTRWHGADCKIAK